jgi:uncharacterized protein (DUF1015 family)
MTSIQPFRAHTLSPEAAKTVVAPHYDSMSAKERGQFADAHRDNYLNAMRSLEEYPQGLAPPIDVLMARNRAVLEKFLVNGSYSKCQSAALYVYRQESSHHVQSGVVAEVPISEYEHGQMLPHEHTRREREQQLTAYLETVGVSSSPVCLAYDAVPGIDSCVEQAMLSQPLLDFRTDDGVRQIIWQVRSAQLIEALQTGFSVVPRTYITDGHHRAAAGAEFAARKRKAGFMPSPEQPWTRLLALLVPLDELQLFSHNRYLPNLEKFDSRRFLSALKGTFKVEKIDSRLVSDEGLTAPGEFIMLLAGESYRLNIKPLYLTGDAVGDLDVSLLQEQVLSPLLDVQDPRSDPRLHFLGGDLGLAGLRARCVGDRDIGFVCFPPTLAQWLAVAGEGKVMPPKSTNFIPKARSGLFVRML